MASLASCNATQSVERWKCTCAHMLQSFRIEWFLWKLILASVHVRQHIQLMISQKKMKRLQFSSAKFSIESRYLLSKYHVHTDLWWNTQKNSMPFVRKLFRKYMYKKKSTFVIEKRISFEQVELHVCLFVLCIYMSLCTYAFHMLTWAYIVCICSMRFCSLSIPLWRRFYRFLLIFTKCIINMIYPCFCINFRIYRRWFSIVFSMLAFCIWIGADYLFNVHQKSTMDTVSGFFSIPSYFVGNTIFLEYWSLHAVYRNQSNLNRYILIWFCLNEQY